MAGVILAGKLRYPEQADFPSIHANGVGDVGQARIHPVPGGAVVDFRGTGRLVVFDSLAEAARFVSDRQDRQNRKESADG